MKLTVDRKYTEIFNDHAEGTSDIEPKIEDIKTLLLSESLIAENIEVWFDNFQGFWRWSSSIK